jgi:hypothetical protein
MDRLVIRQINAEALALRYPRREATGARLSIFFAAFDSPDD